MSLTLSEDEVAELRYAARKITEILGGKAATEKAASSDAWRKEAPSEKQIKILKEKGYAVEGLTRGQASDILDNFFRRRRRGGGKGNATSGNSDY